MKQWIEYKGRQSGRLNLRRHFPIAYATKLRDSGLVTFVDGPAAPMQEPHKLPPKIRTTTPPKASTPEDNVVWSDELDALGWPDLMQRAGEVATARGELVADGAGGRSSVQLRAYIRAYEK